MNMKFIEKVHKFFGCKCKKCCANGNCVCEDKAKAPVVTEAPVEESSAPTEPTNNQM